MIVLDEQLLGRGLERDIAQWYRGTVQFITDLRPHTIIKDEAIPVLLRRQAQPTFVTINERDFWRKVATDQRYCMVCFVLSDARARAHQERGHQTYALRLLGEIAAHRTPLDADAAAAHYYQALTLAEELGMRPLVAHCHRGLETLYATVGQRAQAHTALTTAIEMYRAMDMTFWLPQAEAALAQVC